jgi:hypothetical protein
MKKQCLIAVSERDQIDAMLRIGWLGIKMAHRPFNGRSKCTRLSRSSALSSVAHARRYFRCGSIKADFPGWRPIADDVIGLTTGGADQELSLRRKLETSSKN